MNLVIIAGGGKFGKIAIDFVKRKGYIAFLIDNDPYKAGD